MDVRLPDGTVIRNVPEGTTRQQLVDKLAANGYDTSSLGRTTQEGVDTTASGARAVRGVDVANDELQAYRLPSYRNADPSPGVVEQIRGGASHALDRAAMGLKGLFTDLTPEDRQLLSRGEAFVKGTGPASTVGQIGGDLVIGAAPVAKGAQFLTRALGAMRAPASVVAPVADIAANAAYAAATAPEDRGEAAAWGGGGAAAGRVLSKVLSLGTKPVGEVSPDAQRLMDAGVRPTFGQVMGDKGGVVGRTLSRAEDSLTSVPVVGALLRKRRDAALKDFQRVTREAALPPGAAKESAESIDALANEFHKAYTDTLSAAPFPSLAFNNFTVDDVLQQQAQGRLISGRQLAGARNFVQDVFDTILDPTQPHTAAEAHWIESQIKSQAFAYKKSPVPHQQEYGNLLHDVANDWAQAWRSSLPQDARAAVEALDSQYAKFVPLRRAAATGNVAAPDEYTPRHLLQSIRAGDKSGSKRAFLAGGMPQQDLASAAQNVLTPRVPDSGTAERLLTGVGTLGAGAYGVATYGLSPTAIATALVALGYSTEFAQAYLTGRLAPKAQEQVSQVLKRAAPVIAQMGRAAAVQQQEGR